jgi:hypothetical protein
MLLAFSPHSITEVYIRLGDNERRIWRLLAYVGRYGHQPLDTMRRMTMRELRLMSSQLAAIVEEENAPPKKQHYR